MNVREEIDRYSVAADKPILNWLFDRYHQNWEWRFVARCEIVNHGTQSYMAHRVWAPTAEGRTIYMQRNPAGVITQFLDACRDARAVTLEGGAARVMRISTLCKEYRVLLTEAKPDLTREDALFVLSAVYRAEFNSARGQA